MDEQRFYDEILFVIVLYEKALAQVSSVEKIIEFYRERNLEPAILVYDNSKLSQPAGSVIKYVHDAKNSGVSRAYNTAADLAIEHKKKWMCLLDQDTEVDQDLLLSYNNSFCQFPDEHIFLPKIISSGKIISPYKTFLGKGYSSRSISTGQQNTKKFSIINSCLFIDVKTFKKVGGYDEHYPLDLSDYVFWKRVSKIETTFVLTDSTCEQHHSAHVTQVEQAMSRFKVFLQANKQYRRDAHGMTLLPVFFRGIKLSWRFRSLSFLSLALKSLIQPM
jgi:GT2 family glycosyltransferase